MLSREAALGIGQFILHCTTLNYLDLPGPRHDLRHHSSGNKVSPHS